MRKRVKAFFCALCVGAMLMFLLVLGASAIHYKTPTDAVDFFMASAVYLLVLGPVLCCTMSKSQYQVRACTTGAAVTGQSGKSIATQQVAPNKRQEERNNPRQIISPGAITRPVDEATLDVRTVKSTVTFADIAGYEETKKNLAFVVKCLKNPELLKKVGGKVPSGMLMYGPPGTGKTLLASAIAGTAGVNFYAANASEFVNTFVGVGAKNVRALYAEAKAHAPCIVFIDEIDAIGGKRNELQGQEYRMTLNALLSEMDGIEKNGVITIAATNTFEELDPALIRPGRFDRKVMVPLPNYDDRLAIAKLYAAKYKMSEDVSLENLARDSAGLSGSAIATLFNEASLRALMSDRGIITAADIDGALTQVLTNGEAAKNKNRKDLEIVAYHEAGHAVLVRKLCGEVVPKVTVMGSTTGMAGATYISSNEERLMTSMQQIRNKIIAAYGGRAAEQLIFGKDNVSTGAMHDLQVASRYIRGYIKLGGTNGSLLDEAVFSGRDGASERDLYEARKLSEMLYQEALQYLSDHRDTLERVAQALLEQETLFEEDLDKLL